MKKLLLFLALSCVYLIANAQQVTRCPLDLSSRNSVPGFFATASHDVMWVASQGFNGSLANSKVYARTTDAGVTFTVDTIPDSQDRGGTGIFAWSADTAWVGLSDVFYTSGTAIWRTYDGGQTWAQQSTPVFTTAGSFLNVLCFFTPDSGMAMGDPVGGYFEIYTTVDGGDTWTPVPQSNIPAAQANEWGFQNNYTRVGDHIWFGTSTGRAFRSADRGYTWDVSTVHAQANGVSMNDLNYGGSSAGSSVVYLTTDGGLTWTGTMLNPQIVVDKALAIPGYPGCFLFKAGGAIYSTTDAFESYALLDNSIVYSANPFWIHDVTIAWAEDNILNSDSAVLKIEALPDHVLSPEANTNQLGVFPNPVVSGAALTSFSLTTPVTVKLTLMDITGKRIRQMEINGVAGNNALNFNFSGVESGLYLLHLEANGQRSYRKVMVD